MDRSIDRVLAEPRKRRRSSRTVLMGIILALVGVFFVVHQASASHSVRRHHVRKHHVVRIHYTAQHRYAVKIVPVLDSSVQLFDGAASTVAGSGDLSTLGDNCGTYSQQISIMASQFDGVPHTGTWYSTVGALHHQIMGAYHYMLGALEACGTDAANGDSTSAATAVSDVAAAAQQMRSLDSYAHQLASRR